MGSLRAACYFAGVNHAYYNYPFYRCWRFYAVKKPENLEIKKWLCKNCVIGIKLHKRFIGIESSKTEYQLFSEKSEITASDWTIKRLVDFNPDCSRLLSVRREVLDEVKKWEAFAKEEAKDLAEYERLKAKFGDLK